ncbi:MAG: 4Fe-4S dicluster domain-containing protein [Oscillospiraceae bacterium]|nr:4Fe-4S dicluster domain-containing protein [Oscillospiraceae bacterium]
MRGVYSSVTDQRRKVFTEVARLAFEGGDYSRMEDLSYKIVPGDVAIHRESIFLERAIVEERLRLAIGLPLRDVSEHAPVSRGINESAIAEKYYDPPLINVISFACNSCPTFHYHVTDICQGCLENPCKEVCPKGAIEIRHGKSVIDMDKCIKCGRCKDVCPYGAILKVERPCARACGMDAIGSDEHGRAKIDYERCVSCGMCLVNCPFGAIAEKGQIFQLIHAMKTGRRVVAIVAPAFYGQFGPKVTPEKLTSVMRSVGFADVAEVAVGADLCAIEEAKDFLENVPGKLDFLATSCCPAWSSMAKRLFPELAQNISMALTPMVLTARLEKNKDPDCMVCFIGPCSAKKLEASRKTIRSYVDFVLTFEELMGIFDAKEVDLNDLSSMEDIPLDKGTGAGRGFAVSGGVAAAVTREIEKMAPDREIKTASAQGLAECRKLLQMAKAHKYDGYLLEGMGCPGGCVAGAGTLCAVNKAAMGIERYKKQAPLKDSSETAYIADLKVLEEMTNEI